MLLLSRPIFFLGLAGLGWAGLGWAGLLGDEGGEGLRAALHVRGGDARLGAEPSIRVTPQGRRAGVPLVVFKGGRGGGPLAVLLKGEGGCSRAKSARAVDTVPCF